MPRHRRSGSSIQIGRDRRPMGATGSAENRQRRGFYWAPRQRPATSDYQSAGHYQAGSDGTVRLANGEDRPPTSRRDVSGWTNGVGKTELAKALTELLFGDERAYIRFDMSEFSAEHADHRLLGAPPSYVGYEASGELTNAIREKPFAVVLFDEIEKAHERILAKFLQLLDDGVLTSGRGERVYFSESVFIFTSNLGIYKPVARGNRVHRVLNISPNEDKDYEAVENKVRSEIERYFKNQLNRPEILNRIGENIVVFDFIRPEMLTRFSMRW